MEESQLRLPAVPAVRRGWRAALICIGLVLAVAVSFMDGKVGGRDAAAPAFADGLAAAHALAGEFFVLDLGPLSAAVAVSPTEISAAP